MPLDPSKLVKATKLTHKLNSLEKLLLKENKGDARTSRIIQTLYEQEQAGLISRGERQAKLNSLTKYSKEQARLPGKKISGITHVSVEEATGRGFKKVEDVPKNIGVKEIDPKDLDPAILARFKKVDTTNLRNLKGSEVTDAKAEGRTLYLDIEDAKRLEQSTMKGRELDLERVERAKKYTDNPIELGIMEGKVGVADGHHRIRALEEMGKTKVPIKIDEDFVGSGLHQKLLKQLGEE